MQHVSNVVPFVPASAHELSKAADATIAAVIQDALSDPSDEPARPVETVTPDVAPAEPAAPAIVHTKRRTSALVKRDALLSAVAIAVRVVEKRNHIPVLETLLLRGTDTGLLVEGTDLDIASRVPVIGSCDADLAVAIPAHTLHDILKRTKASDLVAIDVTETMHGDQVNSVYANLDFDGLKVALQALPANDFPRLENDPFTHSFTLPTDDFRRAFARVEHCISVEETRYYLNGIYMHVPHGNQYLRMVATDGHRLGRCDLPMPEGAAGLPGVIVPRKTVRELLKATAGKHAPETITVRVNHTRVQFEIGDAVLLSKLIDGTFPDYQRVIPVYNDKRLVVGNKALATAIEQVNVVSSERGKAVKLALTAGAITLTVTNPDSGTATTTVAADYASDPMDIGFNSQYLCDILDELKGENVTMLVADPGSPMLVTGEPDVDGGLLYVIMPMRV